MALDAHSESPPISGGEVEGDDRPLSGPELRDIGTIVRTFRAKAATLGAPYMREVAQTAVRFRIAQRNYTDRSTMTVSDFDNECRSHGLTTQEIAAFRVMGDDPIFRAVMEEAQTVGSVSLTGWRCLLTAVKGMEGGARKAILKRAAAECQGEGALRALARECKPRKEPTPEQLEAARVRKATIEAERNLVEAVKGLAKAKGMSLVEAYESTIRTVVAEAKPKGREA
jgi:hypothetical protein